MGSVLESLPQGSRVAILRLRSLGDCVLTTPAIEILKRSRPDLRLAIVVEDRFRAIFESNPAITQILPPELGPLRRFSPQLCLNLHGGSRSSWLTAFCGAPDRAGFAHFRHQFLYNFPIPRAQQILGVDRPVHTAEHLASAMFYLGASGNIPRASLFESKDCADRNAADSSFRHFLEAPYAVLHPFAATPEKTWPQAGFLAVAERLKQSGVDPLFIGGPGDDLSPFQAFRTIPQPPLAETKQILARASLFVGNDSGPAHMAAAFGLPVVVIFGASDAAIWGPWQTASAVITSPNGIAHVDVSEVLGALTRLRVPA